MKKKYFLIVLPLFISLFIYLFYRTEKTVINEIVTLLFSFDEFVYLRKGISNLIPLSNHLIYSLPGGLWVFCATLASKFLFLRVGRHEINLIFIPIIFSLGVELTQFLDLTNGRFDVWDIGFSVVFWILANYLFCNDNSRQNILNPFTDKSFICILSYLIVYLADVWK